MNKYLWIFFVAIFSISANVSAGGKPDKQSGIYVKDITAIFALLNEKKELMDSPLLSIDWKGLDGVYVKFTMKDAANWGYIAYLVKKDGVWQIESFDDWVI